MFGYSVFAGYGNIAAGEQDQLWVPRTPRLGRVGVVLVHWSGDPIEFVDINTPKAAALAANLCRVGIPCVSGDLGNQAWGNDTEMSRIDAAWAYLAAQTGVRTDKIALLGISMGGGAVARYSQLHPDKVAAMVGIIPLTDMISLYNENESHHNEIAAAWGVASTAALPVAADTLAGAHLAASVPQQLYYSGSDTTVLPAWVTNYAAAVGPNATTTNVGISGHTDTTVGQVPYSSVGSFLAAHGC